MNNVHIYCLEGRWVRQFISPQEVATMVSIWNWLIWSRSCSILHEILKFPLFDTYASLGQCGCTTGELEHSSLHASDWSVSRQDIHILIHVHKCHFPKTICTEIQRSRLHCIPFGTASHLTAYAYLASHMNSKIVLNWLVDWSGNVSVAISTSFFRRLGQPNNSVRATSLPIFAFAGSICTNWGHAHKCLFTI